MFQMLAKMEFRHNDEELERLIDEYEKARNALKSYLFHEGFDLTVYGPSAKRDEAASGN